MKIHSFTLLAFLTFYCDISLIAQDYEVLTHLTSEDGLPSNEVYSALQSGYGNTWICTDHGLVRYDGENLQLYTERHGLPGKAVFSGVVDVLGNIWLITSGGICMVVGDSIYTPEFNQDLIEHPKYSLLNTISILNDGVIYATTVGPNDGFFKIQSNEVNFIEFPSSIATACEEQLYELVIEDTVVCRGLLRTDRSSICKDTTQEVTWENYKLLSFSRKDLASGNNQYTLTRYRGNYVISVRNDLFWYQGGMPIRHIKCTGDILYHLQIGDEVYISIRDQGLLRYRTSNGYLDTIIHSGSFSYFRLLGVDKIELCDLNKGYVVLALSNKQQIEVSLNIISSVVAKPYYLNSDNIFVYADGYIYQYSFDKNLNYIGAYEIANHSSYSTQFTKAIWHDDRLIFNHGYVDLCDLYNLRYHQEVNPARQIKSRWLLSDDGSILVSDHQIYLLESDSLQLLMDSRIIGKVNDLVELESRVLLIATSQGLYRFSLKDSFLKKISSIGTSTLIKLDENKILCLHKDNTLATYQNMQLIPIDTWFIHSQDIVYTVKKEGSNHVWFFTNNSIVRWECSSVQNLRGDNVKFYRASGYTEVLSVRDSSYLAYDGINLDKVRLVRVNDINDLRLMWSLKNDMVNLDFFKSISTGHVNMHIGGKLTLKLPMDVLKPYGELRYRFIEDPQNWYKPLHGEIDLSTLKEGDYSIELMGMSKSFQWHRLRDYKLSIGYSNSSFSWGFSLFLAFLTSAVTLYLTSSYHKSRDFRLSNVAVQLGALQTYSSQMSPHFFFNSLSSIRSYFKDESSEVLAFINSLSSQIRGVMDSLKYKYVTISSELKRVSEYVKIEQFRTPGLFKFIKELHDEEELSKLMIPPMILQPIIENCIIHAFTDIETGGAIKLVIQIEDDSVAIYIIDNGRGFNTAEPEEGEHKSIGLDSIRLRLAALSKLERKKFQLEIESTRENGTSIKVMIPKIQTNDQNESSNSRG